MSVYAEIRRHVEAHPNTEPDDLAVMFIRGHHIDDLLPLVVNAFKEAIRSDVRLAEIEALRATVSVPRLRTAESLSAALIDLEPLLNKPYRIGDGQARRFGDMTADEHRIRIGMLRASINGLQRDIGIHETAIGLIERNGSVCLNEIRSEAA